MSTITLPPELNALSALSLASSLNREQLWTLTETRVVVGDYRQEYNQVRPHSRLGYESPAVFAARSCPSPAPVGLRPPYAGDGQRTKKNITSTMSQD